MCKSTHDKTDLPLLSSIAGVGARLIPKAPPSCESLGLSGPSAPPDFVGNSKKHEFLSLALWPFIVSYCENVKHSSLPCSLHYLTGLPALPLKQGFCPQALASAARFAGNALSSDATTAPAILFPAPASLLSQRPTPNAPSGPLPHFVSCRSATLGCCAQWRQGFLFVLSLLYPRYLEAREGSGCFEEAESPGDLWEQADIDQLGKI